MGSINFSRSRPLIKHSGTSTGLVQCPRRCFDMPAKVDYGSRTLTACAHLLDINGENSGTFTVNEIRTAVIENAADNFHQLRGSPNRIRAWITGAIRNCKIQGYLTKNGEEMTLSDPANQMLHQLTISVGAPVDHYLEFNRKVKQRLPLRRRTHAQWYEMHEEDLIRVKELEAKIAKLPEGPHLHVVRNDEENDEGEPMAGPSTATPFHTNPFPAIRGFPLAAPSFQTSPVRRSATLPADAYPTPESPPRRARHAHISPHASPSPQPSFSGSDNMYMDVDQEPDLEVQRVPRPAYDVLVADNERLEGELTVAKDSCSTLRQQLEAERTDRATGLAELEAAQTAIDNYLRKLEETTAERIAVTQAHETCRIELNDLQRKHFALQTLQERERWQRSGNAAALLAMRKQVKTLKSKLLEKDEAHADVVANLNAVCAAFNEIGEEHAETRAALVASQTLCADLQQQLEGNQMEYNAHIDGLQGQFDALSERVQARWLDAGGAGPALEAAVDLADALEVETTLRAARINELEAKLERTRKNLRDLQADCAARSRARAEVTRMRIAILANEAREEEEYAQSTQAAP